MAKGRRGTRRGFGAIRRLPSKRWQASYLGPDLNRHPAPFTFETREDAEAWLAAERRIVHDDDWTPPKQRRRRDQDALTLAEYAPGSLDRRRHRGEPLRPRTLALYRSILDRLILPELGHMPLVKATPELVQDWWDRLTPGTPTQRSHAYGLLHTIFNQAIEERVITGPNPCQVRGAGRTNRKRRIEIATPDEVVQIAANMPDRLQLMVMLAAWCGLRFGELTELRRRDIDTEHGFVTVARAVTRIKGEYVVGPPKSEAGARDVAVPPHLLPVVAEHLERHTGPGKNALLFPGHAGEDEHLLHPAFTQKYARAREAAGRPDLRLHDLRHTAAVLAAQSGATLAELMARLGHSSPVMAMRYQHAAQGRDAQIAARLSEMVEGED